ncbi:unnamed protein product [Polarella glacialis]|uniref:cellulase n=1 Tax=Polarella glacialis TaxID=89957 RepID=A0A813L9J8_POLGL|nr:unnamed protein product [Polarella glacialis]
MGSFRAFASLCCSLALLQPGGQAQQAGTVSPEESPAISLQHCSKERGCEQEQAALVLDANWRWVHNVGGDTNCYDNGRWNEAFCPDTETCKRNCAMEGVSAENYKTSYGVETVPDGVELKFLSPGGNVGSRLYVTDGHDAYKMFKLLNREFTLDVDVSTLACGLNGAVYFVEMDEMGGKGKAAGNAAGANKQATAFTPHPCSTTGPVRCTGIDCGIGDGELDRYKGLCDKDGCDSNAYRLGAKSYYGDGPQFQVDSSKPMTVVTQFLTSNGADDGDLVEIRRLYLQDGKLIANAVVNSSAIPSMSELGGEDSITDAQDSITDGLCDAQKRAFGNVNSHQAKGGLRSMGEALRRGMVSSLSLWDDSATQMRWLDSNYPVGADPGRPEWHAGPATDSPAARTTSGSTTPTPTSGTRALSTARSEPPSQSPQAVAKHTCVAASIPKSDQLVAKHTFVATSIPKSDSRVVKHMVPVRGDTFGRAIESANTDLDQLDGPEDMQFFQFVTYTVSLV